jgi:hypothetical protein
MRDKLSFVYFQIYNLIRKYLLKLLVLILLTNVIPFIQEFCGGVQTMFLEHFDPSPVVGELLWFENRFFIAATVQPELLPISYSSLNHPMLRQSISGFDHFEFLHNLLLAHYKGQLQHNNLD